MKRVFKLQKRAARVILDANIRDGSKERFRRLDWLSLKDMFIISSFLKYFGA